MLPSASLRAAALLCGFVLIGGATLRAQTSAAPALGETGGQAPAPVLMQAPNSQRAREDARRASCQSNLKQQMLGILMYVQDHDEKYPAARTWMNDIKPYIGSEKIYVCPEYKSATGKNGYGYAFNQYLSQKKFEGLGNLNELVAIYETSNPERNWFGLGTGRAYRHLGGSNLAFADGHVKFFLRGRERNVQFKP